MFLSVSRGTAASVQGSEKVNFWVASVDARNREYAQLMRKFQVETNLHDASKRTLSEQLHTNHTLKVCILLVPAQSQLTKSTV